MAIKETLLFALGTKLDKEGIKYRDIFSPDDIDSNMFYVEIYLEGDSRFDGSDDYLFEYWIPFQVIVENYDFDSFAHNVLVELFREVYGIRYEPKKHSTEYLKTSKEIDEIIERFEEGI